MKAAIKLMLSGILLVMSVASFANAEVKTDVSKNWTCTTNASSSSIAAEQEADKKLSEKKSSANKAFSSAVSHCRDCTKITCEAAE